MKTSKMPSNLSISMSLSPFVPIADNLDASDEFNRASNFKPNIATSKESTVDDALARSRKNEMLKFARIVRRQPEMKNCRLLPAIF